MYIGCGYLGHYVLVGALSSGAALAIFVRSFASGGGLEPAWRGLLLFSALRAAAHAARLPRLLGSLARRQEE